MKNFTEEQLKALKEIKNLLMLTPIGYASIREFQETDISFEQFLIKLCGRLLEMNISLLKQQTKLLTKTCNPTSKLN